MVDERLNQSRAEIFNLCLTLARSTWQTRVPRCVSAPKVLEPVGRQFGVAHSVLDVLVPQPSLQRPRVVAGVIGAGKPIKSKPSSRRGCLH